MNPYTWSAWALLVMGLSGCAQTYHTTPVQLSPEISRAMVAKGVTAVEVRARQGAIRIRATDGDSIGATARLGPARGRGGLPRECARPERSEVRLSQSGSAVRLELDPVPGDGCVVEWSVDVPRGLYVGARLTAGSIDVVGVEGGLLLESDAGDITVATRAGPISARAGVGSIVLEYAAPSHGRIDLETNVGRVHLYVNDAAVERARAPGAGDRVALSGTRGATIRLGANVGDVTLRLKTAGSAGTGDDRARGR